MSASAILNDARLRVGALVGVCFLLGSTGWLAWLHNIVALAPPQQVDFYTMVIGYLAQAIGIGAYMPVRWKAGKRIAAVASMVAAGLYVVLLEPAASSTQLASAVGFGFAMNLACGFFQGHYLTCLADLVNARGRGIAFGTGYAASTLVTWVLSTIAGGALATGSPSVLACVLIALLTILCIWGVKALPSSVERGDSGATTADSGPKTTPAAALLVLAGITVLVVSMVKNAGFSFPTADLSGSVNLELSRLFYGVGLIVAGILADRDRRYVHICCAASLVTPFLMFALSSAEAPSMTLWALGYLLFGFFTVFRVLLFTDLADCIGHPWLAGAGLAIGRVGDVAGTALCLALGGSAIVLISVCGVLFVVATALLFVLYSRLYGPAAAAGEEDVDPVAEFCKRYGLSEREQDVAFFVIDGLSNPKIARELSVSEATVKFHVRNILKKTSTTNRHELIDLYKSTL